MINVAVAIMLVGLLAILIAACKCSSSDRNDESDIELWIKEYDRTERSQKGPGEN